MTAATPLRARRALLVLVLALLAPLVLAGAARADAPVAVDVDLRTPAGLRVATLVGGLGENGRGFGDIARMAGGGAVGMRRGERVAMRRLDDGSILVRGGLGTRIVLWPSMGGAGIVGDGAIALQPKARETLYVLARGVRSSRPYEPRAGHVVLVLGRPGGALRAAVDRRYRLVRYSPEWSREALLADPARYARVAGVLVGPDVPERALRGIDLPRALYNAGRWVGATGDGRAFQRVMREHLHASIGHGGVLARRPNAAPGMTTHRHLQIREPRFARVRVGEQRRRSARPTPAVVRRANRAAARHLDRGLRRGEADGRAGTVLRQGQPGYAVVPSKPNLAYYTVSVDQQLVIDLSVPSAFAEVPNADLVTNIGVAPTTGYAPAYELNQTLDVVLSPQYTVSLDGQGVQTVTETSASTVGTLVPANGALGAGTYDETSNLVTPLTSHGFYGTLLAPGLAPLLGIYLPGSPGVQQAGLGLIAGYHSVVLGAQSNQPVSATFNPLRSGPTQQVTQVGGDWSSGTDWEQSTESSSTWSISGTLGIGTDSPSGISGGYSSETSNTSSNGGSLSTSVDFTLSNWTTNPLQQNDLAAGTSQAAYSTYSSAIPGAGGLAAPAASSLSYPTAIDGSGDGLVTAPAGYGGNGPGPGCTWQITLTASPWSCWALPGTATFGSGMNVTGYQQGAVSTFTIDPQGRALQVPGTAQPKVIDNLLLAETISFPVTPANRVSTYPVVMQFTQLQIVDQASIAAAQLAPSETGGSRNGLPAPASSTGRGINGGLTTYFGPQGQPINGAPSGTYSTTGLDLCAPPVLTVYLWENGCAADYAAQPPATVYGAGPAIAAVAPAVVQQDGGQAFVVQGAALRCQPGTWSGSPYYTYQWQAWSAASSGWSPITGAIGQTYTPTQPGYYLCTVNAANRQGSASSSSLSVQVIAPMPVPTIGSIAPSSGPPSGGTSVTITGANLSGATAVSFGGVPASSFAVESATQVVATVPPSASGNAGAVSVAVTTPLGTATLTNGYTYAAGAPVVTAIEPATGTTAGGTTVTITGGNLAGASAVSFNGTPATSFSVVSSTEVTAVAPANAAGRVQVLVTTPGGSVVGFFRYVAPEPPTPTARVTAVSPVSGSATGGTSVSIIGAGFTGASAVLFGGVDAPSFEVVSDSFIQATAPAGASGTVDVIVVSATGSAVLPNAFTFLAPPAPSAAVDPLSRTQTIVVSSPTQVTVPITCALANAVVEQCTASIATSSTAFGSGAGVAPAGATAMQVQVPLNAAARAALRGGRPVAVTVSIAATTTSGATVTGSSPTTIVVPSRISSPAGTLFSSAGALSAEGRAFARTVASILPSVPRSVTCAGFEGGVPATAATTRLGRVRAEALCAALRQAGVRPATTKVEWLLPGGGRRAPALPSSPAAIAIG